MFRLILVTLALYAHFGPVMERPPDLAGLSTWYGPPAFLDGDEMANGEPLRLGGATLAVDVSRKAWLGREALVLTECGEIYRVRVTDTGRLANAGLLRLGVRGDRLRYWPVGGQPERELELAERVLERPVAVEETHWLDGDELPVVADFPMRFYADEVACRVDAWGKGDTQRVWIWVLSDD
jgi:hypothetical protein